MPTLSSIFTLFFYLGCISFGGPTAHIGLFQQELIDKRKWMMPDQYAQLVAICQFLPGPSSSQVGMALGYSQQGYKGAFIAWLGFTMPAAIALCVIAVGVMNFDFTNNMYMVVHALKIAAIAIVAHAILSMCQSICKSYRHYIVLLVIFAGCIIFGSAVAQWVWIALAAFWGVVLFRNIDLKLVPLDFKISERVGLSCLVLLVTGWCVLSVLSSNYLIDISRIFYQSGTLVFGGGHVVLPLLQQEIVGAGLVEEPLFTAGYGIVQAMPGPMFNFASYLGAVLVPEHPIAGALLATTMIFIPAALVLFGCLPFLQRLMSITWFHGVMGGISAGVIGLLVATLINPLLKHTVNGFFDIAMILILFAFLYFKRLPVWAIVGGLLLIFSLKNMIV